MGIFNKLFGGKNNKGKSNQELRLEYNVMKNMIIEKSNKYESKELYRHIESGIYEDLKDNDDTKYRISISYELESDESDNQYPLDDVLDKYSLYVSDFYESENSNNSSKYKIELGGELEDIKNVQEIIGKKVYNRDFLDENGEIRVDLLIE